MAGPRAIHDPGKIVVDLAAGLALGGDCLVGIVVLREEHPELAGDLPRALRAIRSARATAPGVMQPPHVPAAYFPCITSRNQGTPPRRPPHADGH